MIIRKSEWLIYQKRPCRHSSSRTFFWNSGTVFSFSLDGHSGSFSLGAKPCLSVSLSIFGISLQHLFLVFPCMLALWPDTNSEATLVVPCIVHDVRRLGMDVYSWTDFSFRASYVCYSWLLSYGTSMSHTGHVTGHESTAFLMSSFSRDIFFGFSLSHYSILVL